MLDTVKSLMVKNLNIIYLHIKVINKPIAINIYVSYYFISAKLYIIIYTHLQHMTTY